MGALLRTVNPMNLHKIFRFFNFEARIIMALNDSTARVEASIAKLGDDVTSQLDAIAAEIKQLADSAASGDTSEIEARLNAAADKLDALSTQVTESTSQLVADDPAANPAP